MFDGYKLVDMDHRPPSVLKRPYPHHYCFVFAPSLLYLEHLGHGNVINPIIRIIERKIKKSLVWYTPHGQRARPVARRPLRLNPKKLSVLRLPLYAHEHATVRDHVRTRVHLPHPTTAKCRITDEAAAW